MEQRWRCASRTSGEVHSGLWTLAIHANDCLSVDNAVDLSADAHKAAAAEVFIDGSLP